MYVCIYTHPQNCIIIIMMSSLCVRVSVVDCAAKYDVIGVCVLGVIIGLTFCLCSNSPLTHEAMTHVYSYYYTNLMD